MLRARCHSASVSFVLETNSPLRGGRPPNSRPTVRFRIDEFDKIAAELGLDTDAAKADFLKVSTAALSKIRRGKNAPSAQFIAAVQLALPSVPYARLFEAQR